MHSFILCGPKSKLLEKYREDLKNSGQFFEPRGHKVYTANTEKRLWPHQNYSLTLQSFHQI